jgi:TatD DNase family protein
MWWDTHCHFTDPQLDSVHVHLDEARLLGVETIIVPSTDLEDAKFAAELSEAHPIFFAAGVHPHEADVLSKESLLEFQRLLHHERCVAIGEIGLDYYYAKQETLTQKRVFQSMLELADKNKLPVILHTRAAEKDVFEIVSRFPEILGVCHSFTGDIELLSKFLDQGFYVSFNGMITFSKGGNIRDLAQYAPLDRILIETDAPYLAPVPHRGETNVPAWIPIIGQKLAEIKGLPVQTIADQTSENALRLFSRTR